MCVSACVRACVRARVLACVKRACVSCFTSEFEQFEIEGAEYDNGFEKRS